MKIRIPLIAVFLVIGAIHLHATTIPVTSTADGGAGSLRAALASAANGDVIDASGVSGTILLTSGELFVTKSVFILGPGPAALAINGNHATRVLHVGSNTVVKIFSLTITNGLAAGASFPNESGSAIYNDRAVLTLVSCAISGNSFTNGNLLGAAIYNDGRTNSATVTIANCTLSGNTGTNGGVGAVYNYGEFGGTATVTIVNSTLNSNFGETAGGVYNDGAYGGRATMTIANSIVSNNSSSFEGGGIYNNGLQGSATLTVSNCSFSGNSAWSYGGAIENNGGGEGSAALTIVNSSFNSNSGFEGAGVFNDGSDGGHATLSVSNCLFTGNTNGDNGVFDYGVIDNNVENDGNATLMVNNSTLSSNIGVGINNEPDLFRGTGSVTIVNSTISGNLGGGVFSTGSAQLTISNSVINGNSVGGFGGGVGNGYGSEATIVHSVINGNSSVGGGAAAGGGVSNSGTLTIADTTISSNSATFFGGGIENQGWLTVSNITLYGNMAIDGGAIYNSATLTVANSTLSSNSASGGFPDEGGGIYNAGADVLDNPAAATLIVANCTLSGNSGVAGAGIYNDGSVGSATLEIGGTILNDNDAGGDIVNDSGTVTSLGYNLSSDAAGGNGSTGPGGLLNSTGDIRNTDPMLGPLQNNGGPTFTHALLPGSPAIDAGDPSFVPPPSYDQRGSGFPRVLANWSGTTRIDIGAYEASLTFAVGDGIPDSWRAHFFANQPPGNSNGTATNSHSCALCDTDGTGQNNLFKYVAGLDPTNPFSIFVLKIANVNGQPNQKNLVFDPEVNGRTYTPQFRTNLVSGSYATLPGIAGPTTNVNQVTVTDTNAVEPQKFYRIDISIP